MPESDKANPPEGLDFETAQFDDRAPGEIHCAGCEAPIADTYYNVNAATVCPRCFEQVARPVPGSLPKALLLLLLIAAGFRAVTGQAPDKPDRYAFWVYSALIAVLSWMTMIRVPGVTVGA